MTCSTRKRALGILGIFFLSCVTKFSLFALSVDINKGSFQPIPIAIPVFAHEAGEASAQLSDV
ncbi:MAG: hypothetical protein ACRCTK_02910, partial [Alphaproteobacteria bacterium]